MSHKKVDQIRQPHGLAIDLSFDASGNSISVNTQLLEACHPCNAGGHDYPCPLGYAEILGTGFDANTATACPIQGSAATSWLVTSAPIENPGSEIVLLFTTWHAGDAILDSTVLIDNFRFPLEPDQVDTTRVSP